ncbi:hypothetical protein C9I92_15235 [Photobacterium ganghwense]|uniref:hypothetical protein n=1 Tax=Photobacterium ganghwense TaxID=320778 RepID=UPI00069E1A2E|nr:hypothetical protein [Photobacterium ganghwense]PSU07106.1 hypothetical protein C9I92_15235 [Photobacterium ganghwense]
MAPAITQVYSKALDEEVQGLLPSTYDCHFYNAIDGFLYRLEIRAIERSMYTGAVIVYKLNYAEGDEYPEEYAEEAFSESQCKFKAAEDALALGIPVHNEQCVARYIFRDMEVTLGEENVVSGKQIRGAYVDPEFQASSITKHVYLTLLEQHGTLISDHTQSIAGHKLWAFGVCKWGVVKVYDSDNKKVLVDLLPGGDSPVNGVVPWSAEGLEQPDLDQLREGHWALGNFRHLVLVLSYHH